MTTPDFRIKIGRIERDGPKHIFPLNDVRALCGVASTDYWLPVALDSQDHNLCDDCLRDYALRTLS